MMIDDRPLSSTMLTLESSNLSSRGVGLTEIDLLALLKRVGSYCGLAATNSFVPSLDEWDALTKVGCESRLTLQAKVGFESRTELLDHFRLHSMVLI